MTGIAQHFILNRTMLVSGFLSQQRDLEHLRLHSSEEGDQRVSAEGNARLALRDVLSRVGNTLRMGGLP